jgi:NAD(P)-dependent dehydrogenase (short-subunit alcohol dehydrogenase family)
MELSDKVIVVTGAGRGIGAAMCRRFARESCNRIVVSDIDTDAAQQVASQIDGLAIRCDVSREDDIAQLIEQTISQFGRIDVFCSNAGITVKGGLSASIDDWQAMWDINVMSRIHAARIVVPAMLQQGGGYLVHTASAAGVLTEIGSAPYSVTKHADVALAEWLSVRYGREGLRVSCVCPLGVQTDMIDDSDPIHRYLHLHAISCEDVAESVITGMQDERFLILPHPEVAEFFSLKTDDHDRWIRGMQRLRQKLTRDISRAKDAA